MSDVTGEAKMPGLAEERPIPRLLALPAELRNRIYEMAILNNTKELFINDDLREPPLASVCRQIRHETREMWYTNQRFCFEFMWEDQAQLEAWWRLSEDFKGEMKVRIEGRGTESEMKGNLAQLAASELFEIAGPIIKTTMSYLSEYQKYSARLVRKR